MRFSTVILGLASLAVAQNASTSLCDKYTTALLKVNNATTQYTLLTLLVNTALIGNYTQPNVGVAVTGILNPGMVNGTEVNLVPYFSGALASSNRGGNSGVAVNFLDDGGAAPLMKNMPSNGNQTSNQYKLVTHLYEFFGYLLGCSAIGQQGFPAYAGSTSMYNTHKFMDLDTVQLTYFITQVGTAAASFGVSTDDIMTVAKALEGLFVQRCAPAVSVPASAEAQLQAICIAPDCPLSANATCAAYGNATMPTYANGTAFNPPNATSSAGGSTGTGASSTASGSGAASTSKSSAASDVFRAEGWMSTTLVSTFVTLSAVCFAFML